MLDERVHTFETLRPERPQPPRPRTNEPVSVHVLDDEEAVLFGTGFEAGVGRLIEELDALGGIEVVVVEHGDPDHFDALPSLIEAYDPTVAVPAADADSLAMVDVSPDVELEHGEHRWGIETIHVPGHTPGNMSFLHDDSGTLYVGDTFVHKNSFAAAPGEWTGELAPIKPGLNDDDGAARSNISILLDYDFDVALVTHGLNVYEDAYDEVETLVDDLRE